MTRLRKVAGVACVGRSPAPYAEAKHSAEVEKWQRECDGWLVASPVERPFRGRFWLMIGWTYHAFLVAMGFTQIPMNNVDEVFLYVACVDWLHLLPVLATLEDCHKRLCSLCLSMACLRTREIRAIQDFMLLDRRINSRRNLQL